MSEKTELIDTAMKAVDKGTSIIERRAQSVIIALLIASNIFMFNKLMSVVDDARKASVKELEPVKNRTDEATILLMEYLKEQKDKNK